MINLRPVETAEKPAASMLSVKDISTTINHEPRILDVRLAEALGFKEPRMIRKLIARHREALDRLGTRSTVERVIKGGKAMEEWLTKKQAIYVASKSDTENATDLLIHVIEVFDAVTSSKPVVVKEHRVRAHRRALPAPAPAAVPKPFEPGSNLLLDLKCAITTANIWVQQGLLPDFGMALERVLFERHGMNGSPHWEAGGPMYDWNWKRRCASEIAA